MTEPAAALRPPSEVSALFNPAYLAILATRTVEGYRRETGSGTPLPVAIVSVAMSLDRDVVASLTMNIRSHVGAWKYGNPRAFARIPRLCESHSGKIRSGIIFALHHRLLTVDDGYLELGSTTIRKNLAGFSDDVAGSQRAANYLGRWFSSGGSPATLLSLLGVRP